MSVEEKNEACMNSVKFFGIICLLVWHASFTKFFTYTTMFFLQMFFFISGYFYKDKYTKAPLEFLSRRTKSLYAPYVSYCLALLTVNDLLVKVGFLEAKYNLGYQALGKSFFSVLQMNGIPRSNQLVGAMWFVPTLLFCSVIFNLISFLLTIKPVRDYESVRFSCVAILFLAGNWLALKQFRLPLEIDISLVALPFYYAGYLYKRYKHYLPSNIFYVIAAVLTLVVCQQYGLIRMAARQYINPPFFLLCGCAGIYVCIFIAKQLVNFGRNELVSYVGKNTMAILALHFLAFKLVSLLMVVTMQLPPALLTTNPVIPTANQYWRLAYIVSGFSLPLLVRFSLDRVWSKITFFRKKEV